MTFKTTEFTLAEAILVQRIAAGDMTAVVELLKSRSTDPDFDPGSLPIKEAARLLNEIAQDAAQDTDEVGSFIAKIQS